MPSVLSLFACLTRAGASACRRLLGAAPRSAVRRTVIACLLVAAGAGPAAATVTDWLTYRAAFVHEDGWVLDRENGYTHSEGQAYTMLLALHYGDRQTFDAVWNWTQETLRRPDGLIAWKWQDGEIIDHNNASDAEIVAAWALIRAGERWGADYLEQGLALLSVIEHRLVVRREGDALILPGTDGFTREEAIVVNPSYWVWPAIDAFRRYGNTALWQRVEETGLRLLDEAGRGTWGLVPDWVLWPDLELWEERSRASYDALRVPLYLVWSGRMPPVVEHWARFWGSTGRAWVDVRTGEVAAYPIQIEHQAVLLLIERTAGDRSLTPGHLPEIGSATSYYGAVITLLARMAWMERFGG